MYAQDEYAQQEAKLIQANGGITGTTSCNVTRGRKAFLSGKEYQPNQTQEWRDGYLTEEYKARKLS